MTKNGFTLIELLVVISILAILTAIAVVSYSGITAKARDSQRIKDLQAIKQALELYRSDLRNYPTTANLPLKDTTSLVGIGTTYLQIPKDQDSVKNYYYLAMPNSPIVCNNLSASTACLSFILCAKKEGTDTAYNFSACDQLDCGAGIKCDIGISSQ